MAQQKVWVEDAHKMSAPFRTTYLLNSRDISRDKKNDREKLRYLEYLLLTVEKSRLYHARQINLKVDSDDVQELLDSHNQELTIDELIEMHEQDQDIEGT
ncbi:hypothetical protein TNCV_1509732 [Trichonephila clavipes]|nr:hypothetical protein TNCV_1509732 [Trichonephila clavipes]